MSRPLPSRTTILIVGGGPVGVSLAISLLKQGVNDFVIVDKLDEMPTTSRAFALHAATMEALATVGVADIIATRSIHASCTQFYSRAGSYLFSIDYHDALKAHSKYPHSYILPQNVTEEILTQYLRDLGVEVWRGKQYAVVGMRGGDDDTAVVEFEGGETIEAKYVIGADGAKSTIRKICGISFEDPRPSASSNQMIVADVHFETPPSFLPPQHRNEMCLIPSSTGFMLFEPFPLEGNDPKGPLIRIATAVPPEMGTPPDHPDVAYWQAAWEKFGPIDNSKIKDTVTSARFRTHTAVADRYFTRFPVEKSGKGEGKGAVVFLIGDAAHIHPPSGGQGMNLGIRDAVYLAPVLVSHMRSATSTGSVDDAPLQEYADLRRQRALVVIGLANGMLDTVLIVGTKFMQMLPQAMGIRRTAEQVQRVLLEWALWGLGKVGPARRGAAYTLSGLEHR